MKNYLLRCIYLITILIVLNVNGFLYMAFGIPQMASIVTYVFLFLIVIFVYIKPVKFEIRYNELFFMLGFLLFVIISTLSKQINDSNIDFKTIDYIFAYFTSLIMFSFFLITLGSFEKKQLDIYLDFIMNLLLFASLMVPLSLYYRIFLANPPMEVTRGFGLFANPNEAGITSCVCLALLMYFNILKNSGWYIFLMIIPILGVLASFSKSAMLLSFVLILLFVFFKRSKTQITTSIFVTLVMLITITSFDFLILKDFGFSDVQIRRLQQVVDIISGDGFNEGTTSSRSLLWNFGYHMFVNQPFIGNGLGSLHHMDYIKNEFGESQGVHNLYLMLLGESGFFPFILIFLSLFFTLAVCLYKSILHRNPNYFLSFSLLFIFLVDAMATHNALSIKFNTIFLSLVFIYYRKARFNGR